MEPLTHIPPPGWPKAVIWQGPEGPRVYKISKSKRRWRGEYGFFGARRGIYYRPFDGRRRCHYIRIRRAEADDNVAPEALPKWLRVSEGL